MAGGLSLDVPITQGRITAIVYHATGASDAIPLQPVGHQRNEGFLARLGDRLFGSGGNDGPSYFVDGGGSGPDTGSVDVGAPAGTGVYSPVDGVVVSVQPYVLNGLERGSIVQIRPRRRAGRDRHCRQPRPTPRHRRGVGGQSLRRRGSAR